MTGTVALLSRHMETLPLGVTESEYTCGVRGARRFVSCRDALESHQVALFSPGGQYGRRLGMSARACSQVRPVCPAQAWMALL